MQAATYPPNSARFKGNLSKAIIVAAARIGDEAGILRGLELAREAVELDPLEGDHRQVQRISSDRCITDSFNYHVYTSRLADSGSRTTAGGHGRRSKPAVRGSGRAHACKPR